MSQEQASYRLGETVAVMWNPTMAAMFPDADHQGCRQEMRHNGQVWEPHNPVKCHGYHCPLCGAATGMFGHRECPAKTQ